jgi:hypothetical protein
VFFPSGFDGRFGDGTVVNPRAVRSRNSPVTEVSPLA